MLWIKNLCVKRVVKGAIGMSHTHATRRLANVWQARLVYKQRFESLARNATDFLGAIRVSTTIKENTERKRLSVSVREIAVCATVTSYNETFTNVKRYCKT